MKRSAALVMLLCLMTACAIALVVFIVRTPGDDPVGTYFGAMGEAYSFLAPGAGEDAGDAGGDANAQGMSPDTANAAGDAQAAGDASPEATGEASIAPAGASAAPETTHDAGIAPASDSGDAAPEITAEAPAVHTAQPAGATAAPDAPITPAPPMQGGDGASVSSPAATDLPAASEAPATATSGAELPGAAEGGAMGAPSIAPAESYGTPRELNENMPKYDYSELAAQTGLSVDVLSKMYTPFYVLDIDMDEVYYPLKSPGGSKGRNKIYGGQVGVQVMSIEGDYAFINAYRYPGGRAIEGYVPVKLLREVTPDDRYSIIIDKRQQRLFLFEYGKLKADMYCSTGKTTTETPAGEFVKYGTKRTIYSDADPDIAYYGIRLNGRVYIHSVSHIGGDYSESIDMLGRKASHGCIRVPLDWAEWFYENIPDNTKILITEYRGDTPPLGEGGRDGD